MVLDGLTPANRLDGARCLRRFSTQAAIYAVGGGLLEVLASPIVEHLPTPAGQKASGMALLNSCYCWGQVAVVVWRFGKVRHTSAVPAGARPKP